MILMVITIRAGNESTSVALASVVTTTTTNPGIGNNFNNTIISNNNSSSKLPTNIQSVVTLPSTEPKRRRRSSKAMNFKSNRSSPIQTRNSTKQQKPLPQQLFAHRHHHI
jgi:hypothetical protein